MTRIVDMKDPSRRFQSVRNNDRISFYVPNGSVFLHAGNVSMSMWAVLAASAASAPIESADASADPLTSVIVDPPMPIRPQSCTGCGPNQPEPVDSEGLSTLPEGIGFPGGIPEFFLEGEIPPEAVAHLDELFGTTNQATGGVNKSQIAEQFKFFFDLNRFLGKMKQDLGSYVTDYKDSTSGSFHQLDLILKTELSGVHQDPITPDEQDWVLNARPRNYEEPAVRSAILRAISNVLDQGTLTAGTEGRMQRLISRIEEHKIRLDKSIERRTQGFTKELTKFFYHPQKGRIAILEGDRNHIFIGLPQNRSSGPSKK